MAFLNSNSNNNKHLSNILHLTCNMCMYLSVTLMLCVEVVQSF